MSPTLVQSIALIADYKEEDIDEIVMEDSQTSASQIDIPTYLI